MIILWAFIPRDIAHACHVAPCTPEATPTWQQPHTQQSPVLELKSPALHHPYQQNPRQREGLRGLKGGLRQLQAVDSPEIFWAPTTCCCIQRPRNDLEAHCKRCACHHTDQPYGHKVQGMHGHKAQVWRSYTIPGAVGPQLSMLARRPGQTHNASTHVSNCSRQGSGCMHEETCSAAGLLPCTRRLDCRSLGPAALCGSARGVSSC